MSHYFGNDNPSKNGKLLQNWEDAMYRYVFLKFVLNDLDKFDDKASTTY